MTVPCPTEGSEDTKKEGSGLTDETELDEVDTCSVSKECAVAFDSESSRPIKCQEQDALSDASAITSKSLSLIYWHW